MPEPRKIFRIEQTVAMRFEPQTENPPAALHRAELMQQMSALRALLAAAPPRQSAAADGSSGDEIERLTSALNLLHAVISGTQHEHAGRNGSGLHAAQMTRIAHELKAVSKGSEEATQKILAAAEDIDQAANSLSAALKDEIHRGLAQDIRDRVIQIFEACNFQDLTSQRVAKVTATLNFIEKEIARALTEIARAHAAPGLHGPRLEGDRGHVSQSDIDIMFGGTVQAGERIAAKHNSAAAAKAATTVNASPSDACSAT